MTVLAITRGLPGCGKTERARRRIARDPDRWVRLNRDDFRAMFHGRRLGTRIAEHQVTVAQRAAISAELRVGYSVIVDDTNLDNNDYTALVLLGLDAGATIELWDMRGVPLETCLKQNMLRDGTPGFVSPQVIEDKYREYINPAYTG